MNVFCGSAGFLEEKFSRRCISLRRNNSPRITDCCQRFLGFTFAVHRSPLFGGAVSSTPGPEEGDVGVANYGHSTPGSHLDILLPTMIGEEKVLTFRDSCVCWLGPAGDTDRLRTGNDSRSEKNTAGLWGGKNVLPAKSSLQTEQRADRFCIESARCFPPESVKVSSKRYAGTCCTKSGFSFFLLPHVKWKAP